MSREPYFIEDGIHENLFFTPRERAILQEEGDVLRGAQSVENIKVLKDKPEIKAADLIFFLFGEAAERAIEKVNVPLLKRFDETQQMEQGRLARAGRPRQAGQLPRREG